MIITLSGEPGSGKSTVARMIAEKLNYKHYSMGDMRRKMALSKGMSLADLNKLGEQEFFTDKEVDEYQATLAKEEDNFVIDGRLSYHFIPNSFKVFLAGDLDVRAERVLNSIRKDERFANLEEAKQSMEERMQSDIKRYKQYYDLDPFNQKNFDFILDTTTLSKEEMVDKVTIAFNEFKAQKKTFK